MQTGFCLGHSRWLSYEQMNGEVCEGEVWKMDVNYKRTDYLSWDEYFMGVAMMFRNAFQGSEFSGRCLYCK